MLFHKSHIKYRLRLCIFFKKMSPTSNLISSPT